LIHLGASVLGPPFGNFSPFGAPASLLTSAHSHRSPHPPHSPLQQHHQHPAPAAAFFPPPLLYWSYPSPPVSPTAYYASPPTHSTTQLTGNIAATQHQTMYSLDFLPAVQPSAVSPPNVAIHSPSTYLPPKPFSALPISPRATGALGGGSGSRSNVGALPPYYNKLPLPLPMLQPQTNNMYHYSSSPSMTASPQPNLLQLPNTPASALPPNRSATTGSMPTTSTVLSIPTTTLLTVDTSQNECASPLKVVPSTPKPTSKISFSRDVAASNVNVVPNACRELYIA
ncbi:PREDICTED: extensin-like, partial [Rhagoletis zephyria]|uniref:extensin-like n=1 Tax=Rhagoletis zephyria TaxID=28612 RepID=UPI00081191F5